MKTYTCCICGEVIKDKSQMIEIDIEDSVCGESCLDKYANRAVEQMPDQDFEFENLEG